MNEMAKLSVQWGNAKMALQKEQSKRKPNSKKITQYLCIMNDCKAELKAKYNIISISLDN